MDSEPRVEEYMTHEVATVSPSDSVVTVTERINEPDGPSGFPVCEEGIVVGFVTGRDLLAAEDTATVAEVMSDDIIVADPEMAITDAARVILRSDIQKLPVVDDEGRLIGIISNTDVIRSQIERATPEKVGKLSRTLTELHGVDIARERRQVELAALIPTQAEVYGDELEGRRYELERGLAEPLVVIDTRDGDAGGLYLADGHHRVLAADQLGIEQMEAYVIVPAEPIDLGIARTAAEQELSSISDVSIVEHSRHPLVKTTTQLQ
ncbi:CBS domain-containing protein [Halonotius terrestris]|uniref:CBS domain-containing protein n=1 Tax=Halonotius terrestris TaxID=2487750 RepID=A0A8J8TBF3_9EURY|nr:CBS domain-containing protein [Halonotius terrestris]TQQ80857.1 CBS domain-containing protein [Halonotius terrestris]